ncbi:MAG: hypothetical protein Q8P05_03185 [Candidatus Diapherotrites archaeon]|nr:hypothetical protein [Candidatus Diapherotrites archaeon]MDZ4256112.1 hypothetical protein [archaeon]
MKQKYKYTEATRVLTQAGMSVGEYARYVDTRGMIRFVPRKVGEWSVRNHGWREVSRTEAERIQRANAGLNRQYMKPRQRKYF